MTRKIRARYANGVLTPDEPLDLEEGAVVELDIQTAPDHETNADKAQISGHTEQQRSYARYGGPEKNEAAP